MIYITNASTSHNMIVHIINLNHKTHKPRCTMPSRPKTKKTKTKTKKATQVTTVCVGLPRSQTIAYQLFFTKLKVEKLVTLH